MLFSQLGDKAISIKRNIVNYNLNLLGNINSFALNKSVLIYTEKTDVLKMSRVWIFGTLDWC